MYICSIKQMNMNMGNSKTIVEVHIGVGLPGSGKTTWMKEKSEEVKYGADAWKALKSGDSYAYAPMLHESWYIDIDNLISDKYHKASVMSLSGKLVVKQLLSYCTCISSSRNNPPTYVWIDGLALNKDDVMLYVRGLSDMIDPQKQIYVGGPGNYEWHVVIDQWNLDREQCLVNDKYRAAKSQREVDSETTIKYAEYSLLKEDDLLKTILDENLHIYDLRVVYHEVPKVQEWQIALNRKGSPDDARILKSEKWSLGGTWGNYLGSTGTVHADNPIENTVLDELLEKIVPDISYLTYKKLMKECVVLKQENETDYYGGSVDYAWWETDLEKLYNFLKSNNVKIKNLQDLA